MAGKTIVQEKLPSSVKVVDQAQEAVAARAEMKKAEKSKAVKYFIETPVANMSDEEKAKAAILTVQIHEGPGRNFDTNKPEYRKGGTLKLIEGRGYTTDPTWAHYIVEQWGSARMGTHQKAGYDMGWTVTRLDPGQERDADSAYREELEELEELRKLR